MVLKRKLPTQAKQEEKKVEQEEKNVDQFDMSIEGEKQGKAKSAEDLAGTDIAEDSKMETSARPEDFIPEELRAMEADSEAAETPEEPVKETEIAAEADIEDQDVMSVFDEQPTQKLDSNEESVFEESVKLEAEDSSQDNIVIDEPIAEVEESFESDSFGADEFAEPAELPGGPIVIDEPTLEEEPAFDSFEKLETPAENDEADSFENISWDDDNLEETPVEAMQEGFMEAKKEKTTESGVPNLDDDVLSSVELMGEDHQLLTLNNDAKKKLVIGVVAILVIVGGALSLTGKDDSKRWASVLDKDGGSITKEEDGSFMFTETEEESDDSNKIVEFKEEDDSGFNLLDNGNKDEVSEEAETQINLLEKEVVETTPSGKEIIKAEDGEKVPGEDEILKELEGESEESTAETETAKETDTGVNLLESISSEIKKQKDAQNALTTDVSETDKAEGDSTEKSGKYEDVNKQVDEQLAEYRKLLAAQEDPGKKIKPGAFFSGDYKQGSAQSESGVTKVDLQKGTATLPEDYVASDQAVAGHQIIKYPKPITREAEQGIRTLDDFRTSIVKKQDKRVRVPRHLKPALRNQGFPKLKVISIVPNYGLVAVYNEQKGALMIGDSIQGWELVGVYRTYAEFKLGNRKHIITLTK